MLKRFTIGLLVLLIVLVPLVGCRSSKVDTEREAILTFTRQALAIEAKRDELVNLWKRYGLVLAVRMFVGGPPFDSSLPGAPKLKAQLVLLDCPPVLQAVKNSLVEIYRLEIEAAQLERQRDLSSLSPGRAQFYSEINRFNVDSYKKAGNTWIDFNSPWVVAQELRRDTYIKWSELLHQHAIDGFTELTTTGQSQGATYLPLNPLGAYIRSLGIPAYGQLPWQELQFKQFALTWASYLASSYLNPAATGEAPTWEDYIKNVGIMGARQAAPQLFRQALGLTHQEQRGLWEILNEGEQRGLVEWGLWGKGQSYVIVQIMAARLPAYELAFEAEYGGDPEASFLEYLMQKYNLTGQ